MLPATNQNIAFVQIDAISFDKRIIHMMPNSLPIFFFVECTMQFGFFSTKQIKCICSLIN